jgi:hypothetical protein
VSIANDVLTGFVRAQSQEHWLTKLAVFGPLSKLDLTDQNWFDPVAAFHDCRSDPEAPSASAFLRQVHKGAGWADDLLQANVQSLQGFICKASANTTGEKKLVFVVVSDKQGAEVLATALGWAALERRSPIFVQRNDLAVEGRGLGGQLVQGLDELGVIVAEICSVAGKKPDLFVKFGRNG